MYSLSVAIILAVSFLRKDNPVLDTTSVYKKQIDFFYVFLSNSKSMLLGALGGCISFGIISTYLFFYNTITLGNIINTLIFADMGNMALYMLPHGFVELIALSVVAIFPIILDLYIVKNVKTVICGDVSLGTIMKNAAIFSLVNVLAIEMILFVAAIIEYIVPRI